jgi:hypothetical protein
MSKLVLLWLVFLLAVKSSAQCDSVDLVGQRFEGEFNINTAIIDHIVDLEIPAKYCIEDLYLFLSEAREEIHELRSFDSVRYGLIELDNNSFELVWKLRKSLSFFPIPFLDVADRDVNVWRTRFDADLSRLNYGLGLYYFNPLRRSDVLFIKAATGFNNELEAFYFLPNLSLDGNWGLKMDYQLLSFSSIAFRTEHNRDIFFETDHGNTVFEQNELRLGIISKIQANRFIDFNIGFARRNLSDNLYKQNPNYLNSGLSSENEWSFGCRLIFDKRDNRRFPKAGYRLDLETRYLKNSNRGRDKAESNIVYKKYWKATAQDLFSIHSVARFQWIQTPYGFKYGRQIGFGNDFVRGYELTSLNAGNFGLVKMDYRRKIWDLSQQVDRIKNWLNIPFDIPIEMYVNVFTDVSKTFLDYQSDRDNSQWGVLLHGYGMGIDFLMFRRFLCSTQYSINRHGEKGIYLHITFTKE